VHRGVIDQAKGILIAAQGCTSHEAFELPAKASQRTHATLHDVATELVERARSRARDRVRRREKRTCSSPRGSGTIRCGRGPVLERSQMQLDGLGVEG
jgi:hypothetical protein